MHEYEAVSVFLEYVNTSIELMLAYVSILSAFLVMSYFAAQKLRSWLAVIVLVLFTLVCLLFILQINLVRNDMGQMYQFLQTQKEAGAMEFGWFGTNPLWAVILLTYLNHIVTFGGYLGSIAFFFYQRKQEA